MLKESSNLLHQTVNFKIDGDYFGKANVISYDYNKYLQDVIDSIIKSN